MSLLVADCPRCGAQKTSFDLLANNSPRKIPQKFLSLRQYEAFCICRHCYLSTVFILTQTDHTTDQYFDSKKDQLVAIDYLNQLVDVDRYVSLKDASSTPPPEHLPTNIEAVFKEGATCFAVGCFNAAGTMFRLCVDLASKKLLPEEAPSKDTKMLASRLKWLFDQNILSEALHDLSNCIKDDGNDGAHDGSLTKIEAEDLLEFTTLLLERIYTEPKKIEIAKQRRLERNSQPT